MTAPVDLATAFAAIDQPWSPLTVSTMNDYDIRLVRTRGEFTRHAQTVNTGDTPSHLTAKRRVI